MTQVTPPWDSPAVRYVPDGGKKKGRFGKPWETMGQQSYGTKVRRWEFPEGGTMFAGLHRQTMGNRGTQS